MKKYVFLFGFFVLICSFGTPKIITLHDYKHYSINIPEPSDICLTTADPSHYFIVGNRGSIIETDSTAKIIRKTKPDGSDYESICMKDHEIYAIDESLRRVDIIDEKDFKVKKSLSLNYSGARNKGFEGLTYIPSAKKFIAVVEKPGIIYEFNEQFQEISHLQSKLFTELSAITYYNNFLWLLSDENHLVIQVNPADYSIINKWNIPVINPEGISFDKDGNLLIVSDDMSELFKYKM